MPRSLSTNQIDKLGARLRAARVIAADDRGLLERLLGDHALATAEVQQLLTERLGLETGSRVKREAGIIEKLRRQPSLPLSRMWDLGGVRVVRDMTRAEQDDLRDQLVAALADPTVKVLDRRASPRHGYRAMHVITQAQGCRVEIQVRTQLQHYWAELIETFAGVWGRQVRYGEPPDQPDMLIAGERSVTRAAFLELLSGFADRIAAYEETVGHIDLTERTLGEEVSGEDRDRVAVARQELQAVRSEILAVFRPMIEAGLIEGSSP
jgi:Region found in RelA / SpoT proteins